jgi:putative SOS response-associated peptidase YedK
MLIIMTRWHKDDLLGRLIERFPDLLKIRHLHNRQVVVLDRSERAAWLDPQTAEEDLLKPSPPVSLKVDKVEGALRKRVAQ